MTSYDTAVEEVFNLYTAYEVHGDWNRFLAEREEYLTTNGWTVEEFLDRSDVFTEN